MYYISFQILIFRIIDAYILEYQYMYTCKFTTLQNKMYKLDLKTRICNTTVPHRGWIPRGTHPGDKFLSTNLVGASGYPKEKLTVLQFVSNKTDGKFIHEFIIRPLIIYISFASDTVTYKTLIYQKYNLYKISPLI